MIPGTFPTGEKLTIYRGASDAINISITDTLGVPVDLTGRTFFAQARDSHRHPTKVEMTVTPVDLTEGTFVVSWDAEDTEEATPCLTRWGIIDDQGFLWIDDQCIITNATPENA